MRLWKTSLASPVRALALILAGLVAISCAGAADAEGPNGASLPPAELAIVAYSTPQPSYERLIEAFRATPQGRNITFTTSFAASGEQARAVESGLKADILHLALEPDVARLVRAGVVAEDWGTNAFKGVGTTSYVAFAVRKGNPLNIRGWEDLVRPGVQVVTPNPFISGGARWNVLAAYGQITQRGGSHDAAVQFLRDLFKNVVVQDDSARRALQTFSSGKGDVLISYVDEAIFARTNGRAIDIVVPDSTLLIETNLVATKTTAYPEQTSAFLDFLHTPQAQAVFAEQGYVPVLDSVKSPHEFVKPVGIFTIGAVGGWTQAQSRFFDSTSGIMVAVERGIGVTVGGR